ncbi:MAG: ornithine carbamoyltransferase [Gemmatales bacterium]|nr:ornithine carbamoyltransferase [Gemmatales bacterium]MDW8386594.1 ornithine carbamoyltransferase [Gemmatales bacterium]
MRHFITLFDLTREELLHLLAMAERLKRQQGRGKRRRELAGKVVALIFEKPSLRTRVSFESAVAQLGGATIFLSGPEVGLGTREAIPDCARTLSQFCDAVILRTFAHSTVETFAEHASVPVINGLTDTHHPCQAISDLFTMQEQFGELRGRTVVFVGDGNNVARSLAVGCGMLGMRFVLAAPKGYGFEPDYSNLLRQRFPEGSFELNGSPTEAVRHADVIYTDVWTSMGQEAEKDTRCQAFRGFQVNRELLEHAPDHAVVMHCLPAHRGEEITSEVLDGQRSIAFQQAGNRLHAQKALLDWLLNQSHRSLRR